MQWSLKTVTGGISQLHCSPIGCHWTPHSLSLSSCWRHLQLHRSCLTDKGTFISCYNSVILWFLNCRGLKWDESLFSSLDYGGRPGQWSQLKCLQVHQMTPIICMCNVSGSRPTCKPHTNIYIIVGDIVSASANSSDIPCLSCVMIRYMVSCTKDLHGKVGIARQQKETMMIVL